MSLKAKDLKYEEAALRKRLEYVQTLKQALSQEDSIFTTTVEAYTSCIDEIIEEIALEVHRAVKTGMDGLEDVHQSRLKNAARFAETEPPASPAEPPAASGGKASGGKGAVDMFGNHVQGTAMDLITCPLCDRPKAAGKFAVHLEKCMGRGRQASRAAARRMSETAAYM